MPAVDGITTRGFEQSCHSVVDVGVETRQRDLITQGDARWVLEEGAREMRDRCPSMQTLRWQIVLRGSVVQEGVFDKAGRSGALNLDTPLSLEMAQNYRQGRWRPTIEANRQAQQAAAVTSREQQQREASQVHALAQASRIPVAASAVAGIRVVQVNAEQCFPQSELRVEIDSMEHVARGDDIYALLKEAIRIWQVCPGVTWTSYKIFLREHEIRSGEGRRGTRLTSKTYVSLEWQQAYERGRKTGAWKAELQQERDGWIGVPESDYPITDEQWTALLVKQTQAAEAVLARERKERDRITQRTAEIKAAMELDGSGLAPFSNQSCHGLKQSPRSSMAPTERDICEAVARYILENPALGYKLQLPESGFICASNHPYRSHWHDGIMCDYRIKRPTVTVGTRLSVSLEDVARPAMGWFLIDKYQRPHYPVIFAFDTKEKRWHVHPKYESELLEVTRRPVRKLSPQEERDQETIARWDAEREQRMRRDTARTEYRSCTMMYGMAGASFHMCGSAPP